MIEFRTHEEMLEKHIGKKGTPEREAYDEEVRKGLEEYRIGEAIRQTRKQQGLTQEELGERMGVQRAQIRPSGTLVKHHSWTCIFLSLSFFLAKIQKGINNSDPILTRQVFETFINC